MCMCLWFLFCLAFIGGIQNTPGGGVGGCGSRSLELGVGPGSCTRGLDVVREFPVQGTRNYLKKWRFHKNIFFETRPEIFPQIVISRDDGKIRGLCFILLVLFL